MLSSLELPCQTSTAVSSPIHIPRLNGLVLSPDSTPLISPKFVVDEDTKCNIISPCDSCATIADGLQTSIFPCHLANACLIHSNRMFPPLDDHDLKAWSMEGIKRGFRSQNDFPCLSPTSRTVYSRGASKDVPEDVNMRATVLRSLDVSRGDAKLGQDANLNVLGLVAPMPGALESTLPHNEHFVATASPDVSDNWLQSRTISGNCGVTAPVVPSYNFGCPVHGGPSPIDPGVSDTTPNVIVENDPELVTELSHWTAEWLHSLIVQPHHLKGHPFVYRGYPVNVCPVLALRISRVIRNLQSPAQVIIHALWYITILTQDDKFERENRGFLKIPIFQYLHSRGSAYAEDFMLRTFAVCAMIADKWINDQSFAAKVWAQISRVPAVIFASLEVFVLHNLNWKVHMTPQQWKDMLVMLRTSEHSRLDFSPFSTTPTLRRTTVTRVLDRLIILADVIGASSGNVVHDHEVSYHTPGSLQHTIHIHAPQPIRPITQLFAPLEWCPEADPIVNKRPRIVGTAPGADRYVSTHKPTTTARDLLDMILRPAQPPVSMPLPWPAGTSFCGPFGAIGHRLAHTVGLGRAWPNSSWFPAQT
ncbi:hypothetical protein V8B97DRAFT_2002028 [Scleroderma yunnanense]